MKNKGITLIALIVTIIVLIILAGISINMLLGENGILTKAKLAKEKTDTSSLDEENKLAKTNELIENYISNRGISSTNSLVMLDSNTTVYVDENGSDTGDGSISNPFKTIQKAVDNCPSITNGYSYSINLAPGNYSSFKISNKYINIYTDPTKATPIINGASVVTREANLQMDGHIKFISDAVSALTISYNSTLFTNYDITVTSTNLVNNWDSCISVVNNSEFMTGMSSVVSVYSNKTGILANIAGRAYIGKVQGTCSYTGTWIARGSDVRIQTNTLSYNKEHNNCTYYVN